MKTLSNFVSKHESFIKDQSEFYALCTAYFAASVLCFKYWDKLFYVPGAIASLSLFVVSCGLFSRTINRAQKYIEDHFSIKQKLTFSIIGLCYASTVICVGYAVFYKSMGL